MLHEFEEAGINVPFAFFEFPAFTGFHFDAVIVAGSSLKLWNVIHFQHQHIVYDFSLCLIDARGRTRLGRTRLGRTPNICCILGVSMLCIFMLSGTHCEYPSVPSTLVIGSSS